MTLRKHLPLAVAVAVIMATSLASTCHLNRAIERGGASHTRQLPGGIRTR